MYRRRSPRTVDITNRRGRRHNAGGPEREQPMDLYVILRRNGWATPQDLEAAAARSTAEGDKDDSGVRWIRSYVLGEESGELGTVCIYEADSPEAIQAH